MENRPLKIVLVGDGTVGKSCMALTFANNAFPHDCPPTVFDNFAKNMVVDGAKFSLNMWDTSGQSDYDRLRPLSYPNTDIFVVCFAVNNKASLKNVVYKWVPEIKHHCPHVPFVLVGTKVDTRQNDPDDPVMISFLEGLETAQKADAVCYLECSALTRHKVDDTFKDTVRAFLSPAATKKKKKLSALCKLL
eukprot:m.4991 g.4991  ORF g.4991 m.4991 type:complete len:191 (+) comp4090_c0_seq1:181-753(+)